MRNELRLDIDRGLVIDQDNNEYSIGEARRKWNANEFDVDVSDITQMLSRLIMKDWSLAELRKFYDETD